MFFKRVRCEGTPKYSSSVSAWSWDTLGGSNILPVRRKSKTTEKGWGLRSKKITLALGEA